MPEETNTAPEGEICTEIALAPRAGPVMRMVRDAPESAKRILTRAFSGAASPRAAIKAQCLTCVGYDREAIKNCTGWSCPLWMYRPFQD
jgi:hypothetical protein